MGIIRDILGEEKGKGSRFVLMVQKGLQIEMFQSNPKVYIIDSLEAAVVTIDDEQVGMFVMDYEECDVVFKKLI